jgi:hypothetical protein
LNSIFEVSSALSVERPALPRLLQLVTLRVLRELRSLGFAGRPHVQTDADTERGIYGSGAAIYWSPPGRQSFAPTRAGRERVISVDETVGLSSGNADGRDPQKGVN